MNERSWITTATLTALILVCLPETTAAQLPFDILEEDLQAVDTTAMHWSNVRTHTGGVEGELAYRVLEVSEGGCKAVALLGGVRLRNLYLRESQRDPVTLQLTVRCPGYRALLDYDGVVARLELRDVATGGLVYQGRNRGFP
ncbi:MAG: hypothetical protein GTO46_10400 [Gemmatimonadetes bacterium]|nr:hypothetical protein [Gemmatimonadota bacterium]NIO32023.1 hypothetical protein [Gemmatimonadota bacterium]